MRIVTLSHSEAHSQYVGQVYQEHYARLRHYFLTQLRNASEADSCAQETISLFFFFMEDRCWEADLEDMPAYLMRIAGGILCSKRMAGKRAWRKNRLGRDAACRLLYKIRDKVIQPFKERLEFKHLFLRAKAAAGSRG